MNHEEEIRRLKRDLYDTRATLIQVLPQAVQDVIDTYHRCNTPTERYRWKRDVVEAIIPLAVELEPANEYSQARGYCPSCNAGSTWGYGSGYALPEGLRRHLTGWGNTQVCVVMEVAFALALDAWGKTRLQLFEEMKKEREEILDERRTAEPHFLIGPGMAKLLDEEVSDATARSDDDSGGPRLLGFSSWFLGSSTGS